MLGTALDNRDRKVNKRDKVPALVDSRHIINILYREVVVRLVEKHKAG